MSAVAQPPEGREIYERNCAICHGAAGKPDPSNPLFQGFERLPADLSDPLFSSREPTRDWLIVATHGGPSLGFSDKMPAFKQALTPAEVTAVIAYAKSLAGADDYPPGDLNFFLPLRTKKAFPEDEVVWKLRQTTRDSTDVLQNRLEIERRLGKRWQVSAELVHEFEGHHGQLVEVEPGVKYVAYFDRARKLIASAGFTASVPLNQAGAPWAAVPYLALGKGFGEQFTLQASARASLPAEDMERDGEAEIAAVVHYAGASARPRGIFPGLEAMATIPFERRGRDAVQFALAPQVRVGLSKRGHVAMNLGVQVPLNERDAYDFRAYAYLIWDFADGMIYEGW